MDDLLKAFKEEDSRGRKQREKPIGSRPFFMDFLTITKSKAYRRLNDKTQAFSLPEHPHIRTRASHTGEVLANASYISESLGLNTDLCMAIAAGHDIGHVPYGHLGEKVLTSIGKKLDKKPFHHAIYSVVLAQEVEKRGRGLNLCFETLEGILHHPVGSGKLNIDYSKPAEYHVVMFADKISYTFADYSDANRTGYFPKEKYAALVEKLNRTFGKETQERREACINALIKESRAKGRISFSEGPEFELFAELRDTMFKEVYPIVDGELHETTLKKLYKFIDTSPEFTEKYNGFDPITFISLLTDKEVTYFGHLLFKSKSIHLKDIQHFGAFELMPELKNKKIEYWNPGLDW